MIDKLLNFIKTDIWRIQLDDLPFGKSFLVKQLRIFILSVRGFDEDKCLMRASSLTFYTLLSIVPVVAMLFGIAKGFGFENRLEKVLLERFPSQQEVLAQIVGYARALLETTKGGVIAGIGVVLLFWAVIKVLSHIEVALNDIWEIKEPRSWGRKFSDYLSIMLISPLLMLVASSAAVFITAQVTQITTEVKLLGVFSPLIFSILKLIPYVLIWILFSVIYIVMPNTKVRLTSGLLAGIIAGTIYQIAQFIYISFQVGVARYNAIYGSFAALPLFLIWVQMSWWIVLFGAELCFANQNVDTYAYEPDSLKVSPEFKKLLTLQVVHLLVKDFAEGEKPLTDAQISRRLAIPLRLLHQILYELVISGLVSETRTDEDKKFGYQPSRDINVFTLNYVIEALEKSGTDTLPVAQTDSLRTLSGLLQEFSSAIENSPANKRLKDI